MVKEAVFHRADSEMCYLADNGNVVITVKTKKNDIADMVLLYSDRYDGKTKSESTGYRLKRSATDELYDYFTIEFRCKFTRLCYYFLVTDKDGNQLYFYQDGFSSNYIFGRQRMFQFPYLHKKDAPNIPQWFKESVMYQIFPDSFAQARECMEELPQSHIIEGGIKVESKLGGTIRGIIENIPYFKELGINLIYLNPVFTANSYHKYDEVDYFNVDPCLGTNEDLKELVEKCHREGIRVMLDLVFNQSSWDFFAFRDVREKGENSKYKNWYHIREFPVKCEGEPNYEAFAFYPQMPKLNTDNPEVEEYLIGVARHWLATCDVDGYRLDVANEMSHDFWRNFRREIGKLKSDLVLIGEVWHDSHSWICNDQFHSVMNYPLLYAIWEFFGYNYLNAHQFNEVLNRLIMLYKRDHVQAMMNFIDTHDVARFLTVSGVSTQRQKLAALFLMTFVGVPLIYYGDEKAMEGTSMDDSRRKMIWQDDERGAEMFDYYKKIVQIRKDNKELVYGSFRTVCADALTNVAGFAREFENNAVYCLFNNSPVAQPVAFAVDDNEVIGCYTELLSGLTLPINNGKVHIELTPYGGAVIKKI